MFILRQRLYSRVFPCIKCLAFFLKMTSYSSVIFEEWLRKTRITASDKIAMDSFILPSFQINCPWYFVLDWGLLYWSQSAKTTLVNVLIILEMNLNTIISRLCDCVKNVHADMRCNFFLKEMHFICIIWTIVEKKFFQNMKILWRLDIYF